MKSYSKLYAFDTAGNVRVWWIDQDNQNYRVNSGVDGGKIVTSAWKESFGKNPGKKNETTNVEQCEKEIEALYTKQLEKKYARTIEEAKKGASYVQPMLAKSYDKAKIKYPCFLQPKLDGVRCILTKDGAFSREGKPFFSAEHILRHLKDQFKHDPDLVLDGELYNHEFKNNFNRIVSLVKTQKLTLEDTLIVQRYVQFHCYDVPSAKMMFSYRDRHEHIESIVGINNPFIKAVKTVLVNNKEEFDTEVGINILEGYEGTMIRYDGVYEFGKRSKNLLKVKEFLDAEFPILAIKEGTGNWAGAAKVVDSVANGEYFSATITGTYEENQEILKNKYLYIGGQATIRYQALTPRGAPRFGVVKALFQQKRDV